MMRVIPYILAAVALGGLVFIARDFLSLSAEVPPLAFKVLLTEVDFATLLIIWGGLPFGFMAWIRIPIIGIFFTDIQLSILWAIHVGASEEDAYWGHLDEDLD